MNEVGWNRKWCVYIHFRFEYVWYVHPIYFMSFTTKWQRDFAIVSYLGFTGGRLRSHFKWTRFEFSLKATLIRLKSRELTFTKRKIYIFLHGVENRTASFYPVLRKKTVAKIANPKDGRPSAVERCALTGFLNLNRSIPPTCRFSLLVRKIPVKFHNWLGKFRRGQLSASKILPDSNFVLRPQTLVANSFNFVDRGTVLFPEMAVLPAQHIFVVFVVVSAVFLNAVAALDLTRLYGHLSAKRNGEPFKFWLLHLAQQRPSDRKQNTDCTKAHKDLAHHMPHTISLRYYNKEHL